ncbi:protein-disulfide reductase DsbD domain-containing protein [Aureimonas flava]|nr:protein-disulfide reductase DsbD domain-containing protein [Aureimonas flava]
MVAAALAAVVAPPPAALAGTDTFVADGVTLRLVALLPDADGRMRAALALDLDPGWKTYWIAPGPVGLAPRLDFSASEGVSDPTVSFPVPIRFAEGEAQSVGYDAPVEFAIHARADTPAPTLRLDAFLGICRELCVPLQAVLEALPSDRLSDRALVARAESTAPAETGLLAPTAARWSADGGSLRFALAHGAGGVPLDAFVSAGDGWAFGPPVTEGSDGAEELSLPVLSRPPNAPDAARVDILLTAGESAQLSRAVPVAPR